MELSLAHYQIWIAPHLTLPSWYQSCFLCCFLHRIPVNINLLTSDEFANWWQTVVHFSRILLWNEFTIDSAQYEMCSRMESYFCGCGRECLTHRLTDTVANRVMWPICWWFDSGSHWTWQKCLVLQASGWKEGHKVLLLWLLWASPSLKYSVFWDTKKLINFYPESTKIENSLHNNTIMANPLLTCPNNRVVTSCPWCHDWHIQPSD